MKIYNENKPLIFIHIPKAGGTSSREVVKEWFGNGFLPHYANKSKGILPLKYDLLSDKWNNQKVIYGHFNEKRKFGISDYYPEIEQFVTILRDPFEIFLSNFFYRHREKKDITPQNLIQAANHHRSYVIHQFPDGINIQNYKEVLEEKFVYIGIAEYMQLTLKNMADKLGFNYSGEVKHLNRTERNITIPSEVKGLFEKNNSLPVLVYKYVFEKFKIENDLL